MNVELIPGGPFDSNIFLVSHGGTRILIDAGTGLGKDRVLKRLEELLDGGGLDAIILTHEHFDHSGGASHLSEHFGAPVFASPECARALREADPDLTGCFMFGTNMDPMMDITEIGDELAIGDLSFEVHSTPGHSPGLISLITHEGRSLFCGDLVFCDGGVGRWDLPGGNLKQLRESVRKALEWDYLSLYPGHGRVETRNPRREVELALAILGDA